jgi:hypothetical protein
MITGYDTNFKFQFFPFCLTIYKHLAKTEKQSKTDEQPTAIA